MKLSIKILTAVSILILLFPDCKKGSDPASDPIVIDLTKPTISVLKPTAGQSFDAGTTILFQATFSDNINLKSYEITITKAVIGGLNLKIVPISAPFSYIKASTSFGLGVKQQEINLNDIVIPSNSATSIITPGKYYFKVTCMDSSNNSLETIVEININ